MPFINLTNIADIHEGSWAKSIFKVGKWYMFTSLIIKGLAVFTMPIFTHYLSPVEIGEYGALNAMKSILPLIVSFGIDGAFIRFFQLYKQDIKKLKSMFSTSYWFVLIVGFISMSICFYSFQLNSQYSNYTIALLCFPLILLQLGQLGIAFFNQSLESHKTTLFQILATVLGVGLSIILVSHYQMGVLGRLIGDAFIAIVLMTMVTVYFLRNKYLKFVFNWQYLKEALWFSVPLLPTGIAAWINTQSPVLMMQQQYPKQDIVGLFSIAASIATIMYFIIDAITQVLSPVVMSGLINDRDRTHKKTRELTLLCMVVVLFAHIGITFFAQEVIMLLSNNNPKYSTAYVYVSGLCIPFLFSIYHRLFSTIISFHQRTVFITIAVLSCASVIYSLNTLLIPKFGASAIAMAQTMGAIVMVSIEFYFARKLEKMNLGLWRLAKFLMVYLIAIVLYYQFFTGFAFSWALFGLKIVFVLLVALVFIMMGNFQNALLDLVGRKLGKR